MALVKVAYTPLENPYPSHLATPLPKSFAGFKSIVPFKTIPKTKPQLLDLLPKNPTKIYGPPPSRRLLLPEWTTDLEVDEGGYVEIGKTRFKCIHCGNWIQTTQEIINNDKTKAKMRYFVEFQQERKEKSEDQYGYHLNGFDCDPFGKQLNTLEKNFLQKFVRGEDIYEDLKWETHPYVAGAWQVVEEVNIGSFRCIDCGNRIHFWHEARRYQDNDRLRWFSSLEWKGIQTKGSS